MILKMLLLKTHFVILLTGVKLVCTLLLFTPHKKTGELNIEIYFI
jgi:hypothetical protein